MKKLIPVLIFTLELSVGLVAGIIWISWRWGGKTEVTKTYKVNPYQPELVTAGDMEQSNFSVYIFSDAETKHPDQLEYGYWSCQASYCGDNGDIYPYTLIDLVSQREGIDDIEAARNLAERKGLIE